MRLWDAFPVDDATRDRREAVGLVRLILKQVESESDLRDRIARDGTISDSVRSPGPRAGRPTLAGPHPPRGRGGQRVPLRPADAPRRRAPGPACDANAEAGSPRGGAGPGGRSGPSRPMRSTTRARPWSTSPAARRRPIAKPSAGPGPRAGFGPVVSIISLWRSPSTGRVTRARRSPRCVALLETIKIHTFKRDPRNLLSFRVSGPRSSTQDSIRLGTHGDALAARAASPTRPWHIIVSVSIRRLEPPSR